MLLSWTSGLEGSSRSFDPDAFLATVYIILKGLSVHRFLYQSRNFFWRAVVSSQIRLFDYSSFFYSIIPPISTFLFFLILTYLRTSFRTSSQVHSTYFSVFLSENFFRRAEQTFCEYWIRLTRNARVYNTRSGKVGSSHCYLDRRPLH